MEEKKRVEQRQINFIYSSPIAFIIDSIRQLASLIQLISSIISAIVLVIDKINLITVIISFYSINSPKAIAETKRKVI